MSALSLIGCTCRDRTDDDVPFAIDPTCAAHAKGGPLYQHIRKICQRCNGGKFASDDYPRCSHPETVCDACKKEMQ